MLITDFKREREVNDTDGLLSALSSRYLVGDHSVNMFWMSHEQEYPQLGIQVNGKLAALHYFSGGDGAGFRALGHVRALDPEGTTQFWISEIDAPDEHPNRFVVEVEIAVKAAKEFMRVAALPISVEWFEL